MSHLAIDIGAGSGRIIRGEVRGNRIVLEEVHRFRNDTVRVDGHERWDVEALFKEIMRGLRKAGRATSIGVDTWGVDFALMDSEGELLELPVSYRDPRTRGMDEHFLRIMSRERIYRKTGIQLMQFNTVFQAFAVARRRSRALKRAERLLMIPDYFNYRLTGRMCMEYTNATTTQMLGARTRAWDADILKSIPIDKKLLSPPIFPGDRIGTLLPELAAASGLGPVPVIAPATHDTGSAVACVPALGTDWAFISSGTWSLVGMELDRPVCTKRAMDFNFSNEGGVAGTYRFLKNVMGLWLIRGLNDSFSKKRSHSELMKLAASARPFERFVDPDCADFLNPRCMRAAFDAYFDRTGQSRPKSDGEFARCALESLALAYRRVLNQIHACVDREIRRVQVIGGGSLNGLLNQMTADAAGLPVYAGPVEGTAIGNVLVQAQAMGRIKSLEEGRACVKRSFPVEKFVPRNTRAWDRAWEKFEAIVAEAR